LRLLRTILTIALTACPALAAGCGSAGSSSSPAVPGLVARSHSSAHKQYAEFANAVNLRADDVPGFVAEPNRREHGHVDNPALEGGTAFRRCFGRFPQSKPVFKGGSEKFKSGGGLASESVSSSVEVMRSATLADREMSLVRKVLASASDQACLSRLFDRLGSEGRPRRVGAATLRITVGRLVLTPIPVGAPASGSSPGAGLSITMNVTYHVSARGRVLAIPAALHLDALAIVVGRAEVTLSTITLGAAFPADMEAQLFSRLAARASNASHFYAAITS
jgi:hypothetical protein